MFDGHLFRRLRILGLGRFSEGGGAPGFHLASRVCGLRRAKTASRVVMR
jgi:hypothetical protein